MKFFEGIKTLDELRKEYRRLAFIYHPDKGGETAIMQVINDQYDRLSKKLGFKSQINSPMTLTAIYNQEEKDFQQKKYNPIGFKP